MTVRSLKETQVLSIRAVTFDLWLTLIWDTEELNEYWKLRQLTNLHRFVRRRTSSSGDTSDGFSFDAVRLALEELSVKIQAIYEGDLDIPPKERGKMLFEIMNMRFAESESDLIYERAGRILSNSGYHSKYPHLNPEAKPTLEALKNRFPGLKIGLISNAGRSVGTYSRMLGSFGIAGYFDSLTISCEVGFLKPRREIFDAALAALAVEPGEVIHVGDSFKADIVGATSMGMNAALYTGLWHRYQKHHHSFAQHIPAGFRAKEPIVMVKEISKLGEVVEMVRKLQLTNEKPSKGKRQLRQA
jgi:HAD superfamily hydrolase (TIGR01549 family)